MYDEKPKADTSCRLPYFVMQICVSSNISIMLSSFVMSQIFTAYGRNQKLFDFTILNIKGNKSIFVISQYTYTFEFIQLHNLIMEFDSIKSVITNGQHVKQGEFSYGLTIDILQSDFGPIVVTGYNNLQLNIIYLNKFCMYSCRYETLAHNYILPLHGTPLRVLIIDMYIHQLGANTYNTCHILPLQKYEYASYSLSILLQTIKHRMHYR